MKQSVFYPISNPTVGKPKPIGYKRPPKNIYYNTLVRDNNERVKLQHSKSYMLKPVIIESIAIHTGELRCYINQSPFYLAIDNFVGKDIPTPDDWKPLTVTHCISAIVHQDYDLPVATLKDPDVWYSEKTKLFLIVDMRWRAYLVTHLYTPTLHRETVEYREDILENRYGGSAKVVTERYTPPSQSRHSLPDEYYRPVAVEVFTQSDSPYKRVSIHMVYRGIYVSRVINELDGERFLKNVFEFIDITPIRARLALSRFGIQDFLAGVKFPNGGYLVVRRGGITQYFQPNYSI